MGLNKKGYIFVYDAMVATIILIIILAISYKNIINEDTQSELQVVRIGNDIVSILEHIDNLNLLSENQIENSMYEMLPENYDMHLKISGNFPQGEFDIGSEIPQDKFVASGKYIFVISELNNIKYFANARYWIWLK
ncbi:hypothetical protein J4403_01040 [Candidatus Woesearchaeota archaeon]|nr:hypothetical protein [Candidatus Woesearchaeota archaeon]